MNRQRVVVVTTTYNEMGMIINTKAEELDLSAQPTHDNTSNALKSLDCIDRQAAIDEVSKYASIWMEYDGGMTQEEVAEAALKAAKRTMVHILEELPSAQPDIIRCGECKHYRRHCDQDDLCMLHNMSIDPDDYCSYAERKEGADG